MSVTASLTAFDSINKRGFSVVGFNGSFDGAAALVVVVVVVVVAGEVSSFEFIRTESVTAFFTCSANMTSIGFTVDVTVVVGIVVVVVVVGGFVVVVTGLSSNQLQYHGFVVVVVVLGVVVDGKRSDFSDSMRPCILSMTLQTSEVSL